MSPTKTKDKKEEGFDILKHGLVPKHRKLSEEEVKKLLEKLDVSKLQLPTIPSTDPVAKKLELKPGDFIEVKRIGMTRSYSYYRRVI